MKIYNIGIDLKRRFIEVLRGIVQNEDVLIRAVISDGGTVVDYSTSNILLLNVRMPDYSETKELQVIETTALQRAEAENGIVEFKLQGEFTRQKGVHQLQISFIDNGNIIKTARFNYCVEEGYADEEASTKDLKSVADILKTVSEAAVKSEALLVNENAREDAERERKTAESARTEGEDVRAYNEETREKKEASRAIAEQERNSAEKARAIGETDRVMAEDNRKLAEKAREKKFENITFSAKTLAPGSAASAKTTVSEDAIMVLIGVPKGEKGDAGEKGADGAKGADGYTPQKGIDYFTEAEKAELLAPAEKKENKIDFVNFSSDDEHYPTAKAVYEALKSKINPLDLRLSEHENKYLELLPVIADIQALLESHSNDITEIKGDMASKEYVDESIGDVETSLENIIKKYGLGGETA